MKEIEMQGIEMEEKYFAIQSTGFPNVKSLVQRSRRQCGNGYVRANWAIVGPMFLTPFGWRTNFPKAGDWDIYSSDTPGGAAEKAGIKF